MPGVALPTVLGGDPALHQGKPVPHWRALLQSEDPGLRLVALQALREIARKQYLRGGRRGEAGVSDEVCEEIVPLLKDRDIETRVAAVEAMAAIQGSHLESPCACADAGFPMLLEMLAQGDVQARRLAVRILGGFYRSTGSTRPVLLGALADVDTMVRDEAAVALGRMRPEPGVTLPALVQALASQQVKIRRQAVGGLRMGLAVVQDEERFADTIAADREALLAGVMTALKDPDERVVVPAIKLAGALGPLAGGVVPTLLRILESGQESSAALTAVSALERIGPAARAAIPALADALRTGVRIRPYAARALTAIAPGETEIAGPAFVQALRTWSAPAASRELAILTAAIGPELLRFIIESLSAHLREESATSRITAAVALENLGARAVDAVPVLVQALSDRDAGVRVASARALGQMGSLATEAVPALNQAISDDDHAVRFAAYDAILKVAPAEVDQIEVLVEMLRTGDAGERARAARVLTKIGPNAGEAVPALMEALQDDFGQVRVDAAVALGAMGAVARPATAALMKVLKSEDTALHMSVQGALYNLWRESSGRIPGVLEALSDSNEDVRLRALQVIQRLGPRGLWAVPALRAALDEDGGEVRWQAALVLASLGVESGAVLPVLMEVLLEPEPADDGTLKQGGRRLRSTTALLRVPFVVSGSADNLSRPLREALRALAKLSSETKGLTEAYLKLLRHWHAHVRFGAAQGLARVRDAGSVAISGLVEVLQDESDLVRSSAAQALGGFGPAAAAAVPGLMDMLADDSPHVRSAAVTALGGIGPPAAAAVSALMRVMEDPEGGVQRRALQALGDIGPAAKIALAPMTVLVLEILEKVRDEKVATVLWKLGPEAVPAVPVLIQALRAEETRGAAGYALEQITLHVEGAGVYLGEALADPDATVRRVAAKALQQLGPSAASQVPALMKALNDSDEEVVSRALDALGGIGIHAGAAVPALLDMILAEEATLDLRRKAGQILWRLGPAAEAAVPVLLNALEGHAGNKAVQNAFYGIRPVSPGVVTYLVDALAENSNAWTRRRVADVLSRFGPAAREAVPALIGLVTGADRGIRQQAIFALGSIGPDARAAVPALLEVLGDPDDAARRDAARALGKIRDTDPATVRRLVEALADPAQEVREAVLTALYQMGWESGANLDGASGRTLILPDTP